MQILNFIWNPSEGIDLGFYMIRFYSLTYVIAFVIGWYIMKSFYKREGVSLDKLESLFVYMVLAIMIGARLGHVIFYQPELFKEDFFSVFLPFSFKGGFRFTGFTGLASHGASIGIIIAMFIYNAKVLKKPILWIFDRIIIPVAIGGMFVRIGNFLNSEIIGKPTSADFPLGVQFVKNYYGRSQLKMEQLMKATNTNNFDDATNALVSDPQYASLLELVPHVHPVQLYEAGGYLLLFFILWWIYWKTEKRFQRGYIFGLFLIILWSVRFIAEYYKKSQGGFEEYLGDALSTGQWLSIPFIIAGVYLMVTSTKKRYSE